MSEKERTLTIKDNVSNIEKLAERTLPAEFFDIFDFLDGLPPSPKLELWPFPFGSQEPKSDGWSSGDTDNSEK